MSRLAFPQNFGESGELEFRDGTRVVPEYLIDMMSGFDTSQYTYQQAVAKANGTLVDERFGRARQDAIRSHFEKVRDGHRD